MSYLIFCSLEVGGFPFRMAEVLNRFGVETYYVYLGKMENGHDSTQFHYGKRKEPWYLSSRFEQIYNNPTKTIQALKQMRSEYQITHCLATGTDAYHLKRAGIRYHYWSFGSDFDYKCFIRTGLKNRWMMLRFVVHPFRVYDERKRARDSIRYSDSAMVSPYQIKAFRNIFPNKDLFFLPHCIKVTDPGETFQQKQIAKGLICKEIQADRYFFSSVRHCWTGDWKRMPDYKGNDILLRSYAKYLSLDSHDHSKLVLVKKRARCGSIKHLVQEIGDREPNRMGR